MALAEKFRIIWLDAYIGQDNECHSFKRMFCRTLEPTATYGDPLDILICTLNQNAAPFTFVDTHEKAIQEIEYYHDKRIIFITSGSLGQRIIPDIISSYHHVYSFYIFCAVIANHYDFALDHRDCLQIFTSELDLLVRLVRDISLEIINRGRGHLAIDDPQTALEYFERSRTLEMTANQTDTLNTASFEHLRLLNGFKDDPGLIQKALHMIEQRQQEEMEDIESEPFVAESRGEEYVDLELEYPDLPSSPQEQGQEADESMTAHQISQEDYP